MTKKINKQTWFKIETIHRANYFITVPLFRNYGKIISRLGGGDFFYYVMWIIEKGTAYPCYPRENFNKGVQYIFNKTINNPTWAESLNKQVAKYGYKYYKFSKKLENKNFVKYSNKLLVKTFQDLINIQDDSHTRGQITTWLIDADYQLFTNHLLKLLKKKVDRNKKKINLAETFSLLTTPEKQSFAEQEVLESLKIAFLLSQDKKAKKIFLENNPEKIIKKLNELDKTLRGKIENHYKKYLWLHYTYEGPILELDYFIKIWQGLIRENKIKLLILEAKNRIKKSIRIRNKIIKELDFNKKEKQLFNIAKDIVWLKGYRKDCMYYGMYVLDKIAVQIGRRLNLSLRQMRYFCDWEIEPALLYGKFNVDELNRRINFSVIYSKSDGRPKIFSGEKGRKFLAGLKLEKEKVLKVKELKGGVAYPGKAKGHIKIVETIEDMKKMNKGDVLVSETTYPALVPAMKLASAIITNVGGLTCHAAIVARELKIPCIVGTKISTKVLKDGDLVKIDANKGIIKILK